MEYEKAVDDFNFGTLLRLVSFSTFYNMISYVWSCNSSD